MVRFLGEKPNAYFGLTDGIEEEDGITIDINRNNKPTVVADWKYLPFKDMSFDFFFWGPPCAEKSKQTPSP